MMNILKIIAVTAVAFCAAACSVNKTSGGRDSGGYAVGVVSSNRIIGSGPSAALPKAIVYKTNGDFLHNVPITLSADRKEIISYPAPSDISEASLPVQLDEGYLLDRRGIGPNTAFTVYTYKEYSELKSAPSLKELKKAVIGGAEVIEIIALPMSVGNAAENIPACNRLIKDGFPGCEIILQRHAVQITPQ